LEKTIIKPGVEGRPALRAKSGAFPGKAIIPRGERPKSKGYLRKLKARFKNF